ncbi:MAG: AAA family ATPase [bacterium]|nr:AAA family ATPase [bacterium]
MAKKFNITGTCIPHRHFMANVSEKIDRIIDMIAEGNYFNINRPRQYGKTTVIYLLEQKLKKNKDYLVIDISLEAIDTPTYEKHERFIPAFLELLMERLEFLREDQTAALIKKNKNISDFKSLSSFIAKMVTKTGRKIVLIIDEVDKSTNNQLFLDFLGMLRAKYLRQIEGKDYSFHSVILAGVHDIKTLKSKIRPEDNKVFNSPWNIAVDFNINLKLSPAEIASMLEEYQKERNVKIDIPFFSEKIFYYTSGYPFLVSYLCKIMDEEILPGSPGKEWQPDALLRALQIALTADNTNFNSLTKNLENNRQLYDFVFDIIMNGIEFSYNIDNPIIRFGTVYGILKEHNGKTKIHNRLYEQRIYNYMASKAETTMKGRITTKGAGSSYINKNDTLDIERVIKKFQQFIKEQYSKKDIDFLERNGRLLFLAFIKPIINGRGFDFKEVQISEEKRLDIVITFGNKKHIIELKIWYGSAYHQEGIKQLYDYLERQNQTVGYLVIFDLRKKTGRAGDWEKIEIEDKKIFTAWV